jgi:N-acetylmuramoyl-L-alanine amidase
VIVHSRAEVFGAQLPTSSSGAPRPKLVNPTYLTIHYTGTSVPWGDPNDTAAEIRSIQDYAGPAGKGWEYNDVIDQAGDVWEYAGDYQAAHSAGENPVARGVLLLLGTTEAPSDAMVAGVRWLRWHLVTTGRLSPVHSMRPHREMPGAATACPGPLVMRRWDEFAAPWQPDPDPQPITERPEEPMRLIQVPGDLAVYKVSATHAVWIKRGDTLDREKVRAEGGAVQSVPVEDLLAYVLVGPSPQGIEGVTTRVEHFATWHP